jgi:putative ABC transport system ATP-binding protein
MSGIVIAVDRLGKQVSDAIGTLTILDDITFSVAARETVAIVGASGSGKSTLLGLIAGLDRASSGSVHLAGQDLFALNEDGRAALRARQVGFVFQSFQLLPHLTALENVMLPLELSGSSNARRASTQMLETVGLASRLQHYPKTLSGGEQQRVALARAFVMRPALLLADEPTGSLDAATGNGVMDLMFELNRQYAATLVLVTHDAAIAGRCERRLTLAAGRLVSDQRGNAQLAADFDARR